MLKYFMILAMLMTLLCTGCVEKNIGGSGLNGVNLDNISEGMYRVGTDIPAGEYLIVSDNNGGIFFIFNNLDRSSKDYLDSAGFINVKQYVKVTNGQYLKFSNSHVLKVD